MTAPHLHAMVIHFPIALIIIAFLTELIALLAKNTFYKDAALYLLIIGTLGTVAAYFSGSSAGSGMTDGFIQEPIGRHEEAALITLVMVIITVLAKSAIKFFDYQKAWAKWASLILFGLLVASVARTGYLGGQLVFEHGAGIELALPEFDAPPEK